VAQLVLELSPSRQFDNATKRDPVFCAEHTAFDASVLHAGANTLEVIAKPSSSDSDDFEFVNIQLHLAP